MTAAAIEYGLDYDAKWFLPVPGAFPDTEHERVDSWVDGLLAEHEVMAAWRDEPMRPALRRLLIAQQQAVAESGVVALWYCPFGLPASAVVEIAVEDREGRPGDVRAELDGLRGALPIRPVEVRARGLGPGAGYARVLSVGSGAEAARIAELGYVFTPGPHAVAIRARSADPGIVGLLSEHLWNLVDSVVLA